MLVKSSDVTSQSHSPAGDIAESLPLFTSSFPMLCPCSASPSPVRIQPLKSTERGDNSLCKRIWRSSSLSTACFLSLFKMRIAFLWLSNHDDAGVFDVEFVILSVLVIDSRKLSVFRSSDSDNGSLCWSGNRTMNDKKLSPCLLCLLPRPHEEDTPPPWISYTQYKIHACCYMMVQWGWNDSTTPVYNNNWIYQEQNTERHEGMTLPK